MAKSIGALTRIEAELSCPICLGVLDTPVITIHCRHAFCRCCIHQALRTGKQRCPLCMEPCTRRQLSDECGHLKGLISSVQALKAAVIAKTGLTEEDARRAESSRKQMEAATTMKSSSTLRCHEHTNCTPEVSDRPPRKKTRRPQLAQNDCGTGTPSRSRGSTSKPDSTPRVLSGVAAIDTPVFSTSNASNDDVCCDVCGDPASYEKNRIVFCDGCDVAVHQACYGVSEIPDGDWFCALCRHHRQRPLNVDAKNTCCALCFQKGGAMKPCFSNATSPASASNGKFAHARCMLWIPNMYEKGRGENSIYLGLDNIEDHQRGKCCSVCRSADGACIECAAKGCTSFFHPYCGFRAGFSHVAAADVSDSANRVRRQAFCLHHSRGKLGVKTVASPAQHGSHSKGSCSRRRVTPCKAPTNIRKPTKSKRLRHKLGKHLPPSCKTPVHNAALAVRSKVSHSELSSNALVGRRLQRWSWSLMRVLHGTVCSWSSAKQLFRVQYDIGGGSPRRNSATPSGYVSPKSCSRDDCGEQRLTREEVLEMIRFKPEKVGRGLRFAASRLSSLQLARLLAFIEEIGASFDAVVSKHTTYVIARANAFMGSARHDVAASGNANESSGGEDDCGSVSESSGGDDDPEIVYKSFANTEALRNAMSLGVPVVAFQWVHECCIGTKLDPGFGKQAGTISEIRIVPVLPFVTLVAPDPFGPVNAVSTSTQVAKIDVSVRPTLKPPELMRTPLQRLVMSGTANAGPNAVGMDKVGYSEVACPGSIESASKLGDGRNNMQ